MIRGYLILIALTVFAASAHAQQVNTKANIRFSSINQIGLISGSQGESSLVQTINGVKKDTWFAGLGVGFDFYGERGAPLFLDVRKELLHKKNTPFIYADGGRYFEWLNFIQKEQRGIPASYAGGYYDVGVGLKLGGKNKGGFLMSAGYSFKRAKEKAQQQTYNPVTRAYETSTYSTNYNYNRVVIKIGFQL